MAVVTSRRYAALSPAARERALFTVPSALARRGGGRPLRLRTRAATGILSVLLGNPLN